MKNATGLTLLLTLGLLGTAAMATETEEPKFEVFSRQDSIELRRYPAFIVAETFVEGELDAASGKGFRAIADYIFGNNVAAGSVQGKGSEKIAMTAPVTMEPLTNAAQASQMPQAMQGAKRWRMHFVMPSSYTLNTLPTPKNPSVQLREVPAKTWAVLSYSGFNTEAAIQQRTDELVEWLAVQKIKTNGNPQLARYNPPWTLPIFRRNEVMLEVD